MSRLHALSLLIYILLASCSQSEPSVDLDYRALNRAVENGHLQPVVVYPEANDVLVMSYMDQARIEQLAGDPEAAIERLEAAVALIINQQGKFDDMLLPIYDELIPLHMEIGNIEQADRLQHRYRAIVDEQYGDQEDIVRDADYRMGCWHAVIGDWYEALFDFEDVVKSFEKEDEIHLFREVQQKQNAEDLAELASKRCKPRW